MKSGVALQSWIFGILLLFASCEHEGRDDESDNKAVSQLEFDFSLEPKDQVSSNIFEEEEIAGAYPLVLAGTGFADDEVDAIHLKEVRIEITSDGAYTDFNMLRIIELTFYNDTLSEQKVAWSNPVPRDQSALELDYTKENLIDFFRAGSFILTSQGLLRERVYEKVNLKAVILLELSRNT